MKTKGIRTQVLHNMVTTSVIYHLAIYARDKNGRISLHSCQSNYIETQNAHNILHNTIFIISKLDII